MLTFLVLAVLVFVVWPTIVGLLWLFLRPVQDWQVRRWAATGRLQLTDRTGPQVTQYLKRSRRYRRIGFVVGVAAAALVVASTDGAPSPPILAVPVVLPMTAAALLAELTPLRCRPDPRRDGVADLAPRTVDRYLPPVLVWIPRAMLLLALGGSAWSLTIRDLPASAIGGVEIVAGAALGIAVLVVGEATERFVVDRRRPGGPFDVVAAEDAIRSQSVHAVAGALIVVLAALLLPAFDRVADRLDPVLASAVALTPSFGFSFGLGCQSHAWRVRWAPPPPPVGPPPPLGVRS